ncbi:MAG: aminotransferase class IV, partial [Pseudomonadota bacterium]|nr:aminotransferase class IV [Pseudomonadota bacterium]
NFHLGTSVFDGLMAYWNDTGYYLHRAEDHLVRFREGAARMWLDFPWSVADMMSGIEALLAREPQGTQYVRPIAYRRAPELWVTGNHGRPVDVSIFTVRTSRDIDALLTCQVSPVERISSRAIPRQTKVSGAYVNSFHARRTAEVAGFDDGLMFDREGRVAEASAANVFTIFRNRLMTPRLCDDVFPGVTRKVVIELAHNNGIDVEEADLRKNDLANADGAFLCSTLMEVRGISRLGERTLATSELPEFKAILKSFRKLTRR